MNTYEAKKQLRIERLEKAGRLAKELSERLHSTARSMAEVIPFGQPILVGHHSERGDRAYRSRIQRRFEKSFELADKAAYYARRAESARLNSNISSDDPEAIFKIEEKIARLEKFQDIMKKVNVLIRKFNFDYEIINGRSALIQNEKVQECIKAIIEAGLLKENTAIEIVKPDFCGRVGFASYSLTNNNANISRLKKRIEELTAKRGQETSEQEIDGVKVVKNVEENRLQMFFDGKPSEEKRKQLKSYGFRWSPSNGCWQAFLNNRADYLIQSITGKAV